ncbi:MAG TPA: hypothetical protein VNG69_17235 [Casimicrobiaceae bacterium]|nr:hypothetical protein [Casimicrobiaceae bacterium]
MDVSIWWVVIGTAFGLCGGIVLFAVLAMASDPEVDTWTDAQAPTRT